MLLGNVVTKARNPMMAVDFENTNDASVFISLLKRWNCLFVDHPLPTKGYSHSIMIDIKVACYNLAKYISELNDHINVEKVYVKGYSKGKYWEEPPTEKGVVSAKLFNSYKHYHTYKYFFHCEEDYEVLLKNYQNIEELLHQFGISSEGTRKVTYDKTGKWSEKPCCVAFSPNVAFMFAEVVTLIGTLEGRNFAAIKYVEQIKKIKKKKNK